MATPAFSRAEVLRGEAWWSNGKDGDGEGHLIAGHFIALGPGLTGGAMPGYGIEISHRFEGLFFRSCAGIYASGQQAFSAGAALAEEPLMILEPQTLMRQGKIKGSASKLRLEGQGLERWLKWEGTPGDALEIPFPEKAPRSFRVELFQSPGMGFRLGEMAPCATSCPVNPQKPSERTGFPFGNNGWQHIVINMLLTGQDPGGAGIYEAFCPGGIHSFVKFRPRIIQLELLERETKIKAIVFRPLTLEKLQKAGGA
jgi:hypothetical protein